MIDFESSDSHLLLNARLPADERERLARSMPDLPGHFFLATSGTTGAMKLVALSKEAVLASAAAVNRRFAAVSGDVWAAVLPPFHVGGLGVFARAHLARGRVVQMEWDAARFAERCASERVTLTSLVPAQVFDLVRGGHAAPASVRAVLVGGGAFDVQLAQAAAGLGWPVYGSYGASECASTIAVADGVASLKLRLLLHVSARAESDGRLAFRSPSLLTAYVLPDGTLADPKIGGWFISEDLGSVEGDSLEVIGRGRDFVKIGGESVSLARLDAILASVAGDGAAVFARPDERLGHVVHLAVVRGADPDLIRTAYDERVLPFERAREVHVVDSIPRTPLGKLLREELAKGLAD